MKGIVLAGGSGTRLYPLTKVVSKQLLPVYDKPMIYYSLSILVLSGIKDIMIISTPNDIGLYEKLFSDGSDLGLNISYKIQPSPDGLAQAFILAEDFIGDENVALVLGDNIFYGSGFSKILKNCVKIVNKEKKALVFGYEVNEPERYGVVNFDENDNVSYVAKEGKVSATNTALFFSEDIEELVALLSKHIPADDSKAEKSPDFFASIQAFISLRIVLLRSESSYTADEKANLQTIKQSWLCYLKNSMLDENDIANRLVREWMLLQQM